MILSASRRTDIPAFYSEWFMDKLRTGSVCVRNPFNTKLISRVKLTPENVDCIVFWTKDANNMLKHLDEINSMGFRYYFQFTITPYERDLEPDVRNKLAILDTFKRLSNKIGKSKVILRYDPIVLTEKYNLAYHDNAFAKICNELYGYTDRIVFSFYDAYKKSERNLKDCNTQLITIDDMNIIAEKFSNVANKYGLSLETCAEGVELSKYNIKHSSCIDGHLIEDVFNIKLNNLDIKDGNRKNCGCMQSIDIGEYDTCVHNCLYCYANSNRSIAHNNYKHNFITSELITGKIDNECIVKDRKEKDIVSNIESQLTLF